MIHAVNERRMFFEIGQHVAEARRPYVLRSLRKPSFQRSSLLTDGEVEVRLIGREDRLFDAELDAVLAAGGPVTDRMGQDLAGEEHHDGPSQSLEAERQDRGHAKQGSADQDLLDAIEVVRPEVEEVRTHQQGSHADTAQRGD